VKPIAVLLAAGEGRSLFPLTKDRPKALLPLNGKTLLERMVRQLHSFGVSRIVIVAGFEKDRVVTSAIKLQQQTGAQIQIVENDRYAETNTLYSVLLAAKHCSGKPLLLIDGDVVCEDKILENVLSSKSEAVLAVDTGRVMGAEEMRVSLNRDHTVSAIGKGLQKGSAEFLGISKFSAPLARKFFRMGRQILARGRQQDFYESAFARLRGHGACFRALDVAGLRWVEIDFLTDYEEGLRLFGARRELEVYRASRRVQPQFLFCPGPVLVSNKVKEALSSAEIGHRELEFSELLNRTRLKLGRVFGVTNFHDYTTVVLTGSGSAANEAVLGSAGLGKKLLILSNGEFGERWISIADFLGLELEALRMRWGQPFDLVEVGKRIRRKGIDAICMVHHETSTGMLNPLENVAALAKRYKKELYVDAVSSVGALPVNVEGNDITFCTGSANKAIASVPGLSFVCGKRTAFDALKTVQPKSLYLDLYKHFVYNDRQYQTPNTPAVNLFFALDAALDEILDTGLSQTFEHSRLLADQLRTGMKRLGFRFFIPEEQMAPVLTTVELPPGYGATEFHENLKRQGYITYPGKGILKDRVFQVANIGKISSRQVRGFLKALEHLVQ
jgi:2-aminoethylphosphonate-pyruvate transaminase